MSQNIESIPSTEVTSISRVVKLARVVFAVGALYSGVNALVDAGGAIGIHNSRQYVQVAGISNPELSADLAAQQSDAEHQAEIELCAAVGTGVGFTLLSLRKRR